MHFRTLICLAAAVALTGCASVKRDTDGYDTESIKSVIKVGETSLTDIRAVFGTPTLTAVCVSDNAQIVGYALAGDGGAATFGKNFGYGMLTFGFGAKTNQVTQKNVIFKFNDDGILTDYQRNGVSYLIRKRLTFWNECERKLTEDEVLRRVNYSADEVCKNYAKDVAAKEGIPVSEVDTGKEFEFCNIPCQTERAAKEFYGELKDVEMLVPSQEGDGSKGHILFK